MQVREHLGVHGEGGRAGLGERVEEAVGIRNHQVHVERHGGHALERSDDGDANRDVRHEVAVHDVHVDEISPAALRRADGLAERGEVRGEDRRRDPDRHRLTSREIGSPGATRNPAGGWCRRTMPAGTPG